MIYTSQELFELIKNRTEPIAIPRIGDGELRILNRDYGMVLQRQFGYVPPHEQCEAIRENLIEAYRKADIIGMPLNKREGLNDYWYRCEEILYAACPEAKDKNKASIDFHTDWLRDGLYGELLNDRKIYYISSRTVGPQLMQAFYTAAVYSFKVAPEAKFSAEIRGEKHYPDQFNQIKAWMNEINPVGSICLVGAGVVGKIYTTWFRDRGGIAIDIGSVFDSWAGLQTRGAGRGIGAIDESYKL